jgi:hypothetical protein
LTPISLPRSENLHQLECSIIMPDVVIT